MKQEINHAPFSGVVDTVAWAEINPHFLDAVANRFDVTKVSQAGIPDASEDLGFAHHIFEA